MPSMTSGGVAAAEYSATEVTMTCSMLVAFRMPATSGARASSVTIARMPESAATIAASRGV